VLWAVARAAQPLLKVDDILGYHVDVIDGEYQFRNVVGTEGSDAVERIKVMADLLERRRTRPGSLGWVESLRARVYEKVVRLGIAEPADRMLLSEIRTYGPRWMYTLGVPRVKELLHLRCHHIDGHGATLLVGPRLKDDAVRAVERNMLMMLSAHVKAGLRLRRRLAQQGAAAKGAALDAPSGGAVLDAGGNLVHAEGEAKAHDARSILEAKAREIDRARTKSAPA
jgi:hypothetical protein